MKNKTQLAKIVKWVARLSSIPGIAFVLFMVGAHLINPEPLTRELTAHEITLFAFFPVGVLLGLMTAWKWEGIGGVLAVGSIAGFHLIDMQFTFNFWIDGVS